MSINPNGPQMMTTMKDFLILSKIGKLSIPSCLKMIEIFVLQVMEHTLRYTKLGEQVMVKFMRLKK